MIGTRGGRGLVYGRNKKKRGHMQVYSNQHKSYLHVLELTLAGLTLKDSDMKVSP